MFHQLIKLRSIALTALLTSTVTLADPPKPTGTPQVVPWARKVTKDLPKNRTGGAITDKGPGGSEASLFFIAPKSTGLTTQELPDIYWYISAPSKVVTFTLLRADQRNKTVIRLELKDVQSGFHKIDLAREAKAHNLKPLETNDWTPSADNANAPQFKALYRMALKGEDPKLLATAYIARVKAPPGAAAGDYALQIKNELWFDAVQSLADQLGAEAAAKSPPRQQFSQLLQAEDVLRSDVSDTANDEVKAKARAEEEKVIGKLSVPDPIDLKSDKWEPKSVPDPIDLK
jgi:hypothetical protein